MAYYPCIKRALDILLAVAALFWLLPLLGVIALLVKMDSDGPVFFKQERVGRGMQPFPLIKFRTMTSRPPGPDTQFDPGDACRVTTIGAILRKTKLDELPELLNVLKGDMSIVGPRPEVPKYTRLFADDFRKILTVRPGLSDHASIKYRSEEEMLAAQANPEAWYCDFILPDKLDIARKYTRRITFRGDVAVVWETVKSLFRK
jgi:lipopolysaccharide/colanic/teichoic acid biosynthesis glycosyltransferase